MNTYVRIFDESSVFWEGSVEVNNMLLKVQESYFNDRLRACGHVFLNEVYDALGLLRSKEGATMGWEVWSEEPISFNITETDIQNRFKLTFNVEVIYDKLRSEEEYQELTEE